MLDINLKTIDESEKEVVVKNHSFQDVKKAQELYDRLTEEYAEQSVPFFDNDEKIIKLELSKDDNDEMESECYLEYSDELLNSLYNRL
ncbi:hypothetical protein [Salinicoccus sp. Marseille-QA3877]